MLDLLLLAAVFCLLALGPTVFVLRSALQAADQDRRHRAYLAEVESLAQGTRPPCLRRGLDQA